MPTCGGDPVLEVLRRVDARGSGLSSLSVPGVSLLLQKAGGLLAPEVELLLAESRLDPAGRISFEDLLALLGAPVLAAGAAPPATGKVARAEQLEPDSPSEAAVGTEIEEGLAERDEVFDQETDAARFVQRAYRRHCARERLRRESAAAACVRSLNRGKWTNRITASSGRLADAADGVAEGADRDMGYEWPELELSGQQRELEHSGQQRASGVSNLERMSEIYDGGAVTEEEMFEALARVAETQGLPWHATDREDLDSDADCQTIQTQLPLRERQSELSKQPGEWELSKQPRESELFKQPRESELSKHLIEFEHSKQPRESELSKQPRESELSKQPRASDLSSLRRGSTQSELWDGSLAMPEHEVLEALAIVAETQGLSWRATDTE